MAALAATPTGKLGDAIGVKEPGKKIKAKFHDTPTGFFILCCSGCRISVCACMVENQYMYEWITRGFE